MTNSTLAASLCAKFSPHEWILLPLHSSAPCWHRKSIPLPCASDCFYRSNNIIYYSKWRNTNLSYFFCQKFRKQLTQKIAWRCEEIAHLWFAKWNEFQIDELLEMAIVWFQLIFYKSNAVRAQWFVINCYVHLKIQVFFSKKNNLGKKSYSEISRSHYMFTLFCPKTCGTNAINAHKIKRTDFIATKTTTTTMTTNRSQGRQKIDWPVTWIHTSAMRSLLKSSANKLKCNQCNRQLFIAR